MTIRLLTRLERYRLVVFLAALLFGLLLTWLRPAGFDRFALQFEDFKFHIRTGLGFDPAGDERLVLVSVDETSVNRLGRWPWDRRVLADLFAGLDEATVVGLDMVFSEPTTPDQDSQLAEQIADNSNLILGFFLRDRASQETTPASLDLIQDCAYANYKLQDDTVGVKEFPYAEINIAPFAEAGLSCAFFSAEPDADGLYRRYPLAYVHQGYLFPPLAMQMLRYHLNRDVRLELDRQGVVDIQLGGLALGRGNNFRLNFYDLPTIKVVPAVDVLQGKVAPGFFKDKVVLVGVTEMAVYDMRPTPIDPVTPGVLLHYAAFLNLLRHEMLQDAPWLDLLLLLLLLAAAVVISLRSNVYVRGALYVLAASVAVLLANYLFLIHLLWLREFYALAPFFLAVIALEAVAFMHTDLKARELKRAFSSYVSPELVREILKDPERLGLGGQEREITVLFSDIRKFTSLSESVTPTQLVQILTQIHDPMTNIVLGSKGMLDKYIGDAMMALFNTPVDVADHADRAVACGLAMVQCLDEINQRFESQGLPQIGIGVGINTGRCIVGNMGSRVRFEYTAIGDAVNLASRLEGLCKTYHSRIVISQHTREKLTRPFLLRKLDKVRVKGKSVPVEIYEVMVDTATNREIGERFEAGLMSYFAMDFATALPIFEGLALERHDAVASMFSQRCRIFMRQPPEPSWQGVFVMETK